MVARFEYGFDLPVADSDHDYITGVNSLAGALLTSGVYRASLQDQGLDSVVLLMEAPQMIDVVTGVKVDVGSSPVGNSEYFDLQPLVDQLFVTLFRV